MLMSNQNFRGLRPRVFNCTEQVIAEISRCFLATQNVNIAAVFARALDAAEKQDFNKNSVVFPLFPNVF